MATVSTATAFARRRHETTKGKEKGKEKAPDKLNENLLVPPIVLLFLGAQYLLTRTRPHSPSRSNSLIVEDLAELDRLSAFERLSDSRQSNLALRKRGHLNRHHS